MGRYDVRVVDNDVHRVGDGIVMHTLVPCPALVERRSALEYAISKRISKLKVDSAMSAVEWYRKRGFTKYGNAQHMNDTLEEEKPIEAEENIDCGCAMMEFRFYWD